MASETAQLKGRRAAEHGRDGKTAFHGEIGAQTIPLGADALEAEGLPRLHGDRLVKGHRLSIELGRERRAAQRHAPLGRKLQRRPLHDHFEAGKVFIIA